MKRKILTILSLCMILSTLPGCEAQHNKDISSSAATSFFEPSLSPEDSFSNEEISPSKKEEERKNWKMNVLEDPEVGLIIEKENGKSILLLMNQIIRSMDSGMTEYLMPPDKVLAYVSIPQLRPISIAGAHGGLEAYSVHDSSSGGRMFVFYGSIRNIDNCACYCFFIKKSLYLNDFDGLVEENSTLEDVERIDPAVKINFFNHDDMEPNYYVSFLDECAMWGDYYYYSVHATKDGIVNIGYEKEGNDFVVHEIYKSDFSRTDSEIYDPVAAINENDWP